MVSVSIRRKKKFHAFRLDQKKQQIYRRRWYARYGSGPSSPSLILSSSLLFHFWQSQRFSLASDRCISIEMKILNFFYAPKLTSDSFVTLSHMESHIIQLTPPTNRIQKVTFGHGNCLVCEWVRYIYWMTNLVFRSISIRSWIRRNEFRTNKA